MNNYQGCDGVEILRLVIVHGFKCILDMLRAAKCAKSMWELAQNSIFRRCVAHQELSIDGGAKWHFSGIRYFPRESVFLVAPNRVLHLGGIDYKLTQRLKFGEIDIKLFSLIFYSTEDGSPIFDTYKEPDVPYYTYTETPYELLRKHVYEGEKLVKTIFHVKKREP